jgi:hypothetical protein
MTKRDGTESLRFFNKKADKLLGLSFTNSVFGESTRLEISMEDGGPLKVCRWGPGDEATDAFVLTFRFFIQDNESSSLRNMAEIYEALPISEERKVTFQAIRSGINKFLDRKSMINVDGYHFTEREIIEIFVFGGLSHANLAKEREYEKWMSDVLLKALTTSQFVFCVGTVLQAIQHVRSLNGQVLNDLKVEG